jgi:rhomboid protease GluP
MQRQTEGSMLCPSCRKLISVAAPRCPHCGAARPGMFGYGPAVTRMLGDLDPVRVIPIVCIILYVLALAIDPRAIFRGSASILGLLSPSSKALFLLGSTQPLDLRFGRYWTLLSAIYLHGSILHIAFNVLWIRNVAPEVQRAFGAARFFVIWTFAGAFGFFISDLVPSPGSVGASGSIFGLFAALIVYGRVIGASLLTRQIWQWAIILGIMGFLLPGVDNYAHVGGFVGGWIAATLYRGSLGRPTGPRTTILALLLMAATALAFALSVVTGLSLLS